ncbi:hypothetical protein P7C70_g2253, partial [Phenoliferia sp. Uapishka_3]
MAGGREMIVLGDSDDEGGYDHRNGGQVDPEDVEALGKLDQELYELRQQISDLQQLESTLRVDKSDLQLKIATKQRKKSKFAPRTQSLVAAKQPKADPRAVNYTKSDFPWSQGIKNKAKEVWGITSFRMCQEGSLNATLDGRDLMVVMPTGNLLPISGIRSKLLRRFKRTGGGKTLIYTLASLLLEGTTVVVTPLISLMQDQTYNLNELNIRAEMLNAATDQAEAKNLMKRMVTGGNTSAAKGSGKGKAVPLRTDEDEREIKLVFVTPEKIDKSKTFVSTLQKMYDAGLLARIVIDEAHCCSGLGHDYRTSYLCLGKLKTLFPKTPITALTATAPQSVIDDTLKILHMPRTTSPGESAVPKTTVLFTAPLYRSNLHYSVLQRPQQADAAIEALSKWILDNREGETGIIYCLVKIRSHGMSEVKAYTARCLQSRADTEKVSEGINKKSGGRIKSAVYHSYVSDVRPENLFEPSSGKVEVDRISYIQVDKLYIHKQWRRKQIHCVVATNAFGLGIDSPDCRYVLHHSCLRDLDTLETIDISEDVYRALRILTAAERQSATLTLTQAAELVRGLGGGSFSTNQGKTKGKGTVNIVDEAGEKVTLGKEGAESLIVRLLVDGYLREEFYNSSFLIYSGSQRGPDLTEMSPAAYATLSYIKVVPTRSLRLTRYTPAEVTTNGLAVTIQATVVKKGKTIRKASVKASVKRKLPGATSPRPVKKTKGKTPMIAEASEEEDSETFDFEDEEPILRGGNRPDPDEDEEIAEAQVFGIGLEECEDDDEAEEEWKIWGREKLAGGK